MTFQKSSLIHFQLSEATRNSFHAQGGTIVVVTIGSIPRNDASIAENVHVVQREQCVPLRCQLLLPPIDHFDHRDVAAQFLRKTSRVYLFAQIRDGNMNLENMV